MPKLDIIRAWKDEEYCESLTLAERARVPQNPAGVIELTDPEMHQVEGGTITFDPIMCGSAITVCTYDPLWCPVTITITIDAASDAKSS